MAVKIALVYGVVEALPWFDPVHAYTYIMPALELIVMVVKKVRREGSGLCVGTDGL